MELDAVALDPWQGIYRQLRQQILSGKFAAGERLVEAELAAAFRTSRGPVRTALRELDRAGLVDLLPRRGAFVKTFSEKDVEEILTLWEVMWLFALTRAVERVTDEDIANLRRLFETLPADDDAEGLLDFARDFHRAVFKIADHGRALQIFEELLSAQARVLWLTAAERWTELELEQTGPAMIEALARRDVQAAAEASLGWREQLGDFLIERSSATTSAAGGGG